MVDVAERLREVRERIASAARGAGRDPSEVTLVAVSKEVDASAVQAAYDAGQRHFGENRAQELLAKVGALSDATTADPLVWHFIGRLQRNKVKSIAASVALWHSVDRSEIGEAIARSAPGARVLIQVNVADEAQKGGCRPGDAPALLEVLAGLGLHVEGLMTVPPQVGDPRPHFAALRELAASLGLEALSMGMSGDFEAAIAQGATLVRVGTTLFGARPGSGAPGAPGGSQP
jgi:pyridoxal phosphate enzyme (YggS family)